VSVAASRLLKVRGIRFFLLLWLPLFIVPQPHTQSTDVSPIMSCPLPPLSLTRPSFDLYN
jgi:hypothetical protein